MARAWSSYGSSLTSGSLKLFRATLAGACSNSQSFGTIRNWQPPYYVISRSRPQRPH